MTSTVYLEEESADLGEEGWSEWSDWVWSEEQGYSYSARYGPDGQIEYNYLHPEVAEGNTVHYDDWTEDKDEQYEGVSSSWENYPYITDAKPTSFSKNRPFLNTRSKNGPVPQGPDQENGETVAAEVNLSSDFQVISKPTRFFKIGRVFKTRWTEPAGETPEGGTPFISTAPLGGKIFTQMRNFVVVREMKGCCICLSLFTYKGQGTAKQGLRPEDYAAVYASGSTAKVLLAENIIKEPFPIIVENFLESISPMSHLDFGRIYTVEHNLQVLKVGRIPDEHHPRLDRYFVETIVGPDRKDTFSAPLSSDLASAAAGQNNLPGAPISLDRDNNSPLASGLASLSIESRLPEFEIHGPNGDRKFATHITSSSNKALSNAYIEIDERKHKKFWKPGRVFMMLWTEPARSDRRGSSTGSQYEMVWLNQKVFSEIRRFVVIGEGYGNVICSPIHTYSGQATLKPNLPDIQQHAIIYTSEMPPEAICEYDEDGNVVAREELSKAPIRVRSETEGPDGDLGELGRLNYAKIYTVEKYVRVRNIGRVHEDSMEDLLASCFFARPPDQPPQRPRKRSSKPKGKSKETRASEKQSQATGANESDDKMDASASAQA